MRDHKISCKLAGQEGEDLERLKDVVAEFYVEKIGRMLNGSGLSVAERVEVLEGLIEALRSGGRKEE